MSDTGVMSNSAILKASGLKKSYGDLPVVKGVSLDLLPGEFVSLVGRSGSGKTTLLALLSGLERADAGQVWLDGVDITTAATTTESEDALALLRRRSVGFIFQSFQLIPTLTAWENVALPLFPVKMPEAERRERAQALLKQMGLGSRLEHLPGELSGGEKQRVAIARSLIGRPKIIFADEPTGNLDFQTGQEIMDILRRLNTEDGIAILMVTHDLELSKSANRVLHMQDGELLA
ncbi:MAG: ABC transporter ATP-binding protein [Humidesulfovibrio sp.]|nr:ABC transporter ATP-binding protein [Humidesulfovibrio sp.]